MLIPCVSLTPTRCHIPRERIALTAITTAATLKVNIIELFSDTNIRLKLRYLNRRIVIFAITESHEANLRIGNGVAFIDFAHSIAKTLADCLEHRTHRTGYIKSEYNRSRVGVFCTITTLPELKLCGIKRILHSTRSIHLTCRTGSRIALRCRVICPT